MILAVNRVFSVVHNEKNTGGVKEADFQIYTQDLCCKLTQFPTQKPFLLLYDDAPGHARTENTLEEFDVAGKRLPNYNPELNAIEFCFSIFQITVEEVDSLGRSG